MAHGEQLGGFGDRIRERRGSAVDPRPGHSKISVGRRREKPRGVQLSYFTYAKR
jgi:hypothetical protein